MKSTSSISPRNSTSSQPPLAHDAHGRPLTMPDGAVSWGIKRHTPGRPKNILGPDRRPVRLPLDTTADEIAEMFGPGLYRLDALDEQGSTIDFVTTVEVGDDDERGEVRGGDRRDRSQLDGRASDLRYALQTISDMARTQADAFKCVAEAQADWVKGLANARALPRNAAPIVPFAPPSPAVPVAANDNARATEPEEDEVEDHEDHDASETSEVSPLAHVASIASTVGTIFHDMKPMVASMLGRRNANAAPAPDAPVAAGATAPPPSASSPPPSTPPSPNPMAHLCAIEEHLSRSELKILRRILRGDNASGLTDELLARTVEDAVAYIRAMVASACAERSVATTDSASMAPDLAQQSDLARMARAIEVMNRLTPDEQADARGIMSRLAPERVEELARRLFAMSVDDAVAWLRENLAGLLAEAAS